MDSGAAAYLHCNKAQYINTQSMKIANPVGWFDIYVSDLDRAKKGRSTGRAGRR